MLSRGECRWDYIQTVYVSPIVCRHAGALERNNEFDANAGRTTSGAMGFDPPTPGNRHWQIVLPFLVVSCFDVALRMQVELLPLKLVVAGSNPAGPRSGGP